MKRFVFLLILILQSFNSFAQFTSIVQPTINSFFFAEVSEPNNVALAGGVKLIKSTDSGVTWSEVSLGVYAMPWTNYIYNDAVVISNTEYFLIGKDDLNNKSCVLKTTDGGSNWSIVLESANGSYNQFSDIEYGAGTLIVASKGKVYVSSDLGLNWTIQTMGTSSFTAKNINFNPSSNKWLTSLYSGGNFHQSNNSGVTWSEHTFTQFNSSSIQKVNCANNKFILTKRFAGYGNIYEVDANLNVLDTTTLTVVSTSNLELIEANYLPNGAMITYTLADFMYIDPLTELHYFYPHHLINSDGNEEQITDLDLGQTFGIAVGPYGAISRINLTLPNQVFVPAKFTATFNGCINGLITATPNYNYANSYSWFLDGSFVSNNQVLSVNAPALPGSHNLTLVTSYNGTTDTMEWDFTVNSLIPPPVFTANFDQTPCYNDDSYVQVVYQSGDVTSTTLSVYLGTQAIYGPVNVTTSNINFTTPIISQTDTLRFVFAKTQMCGISYDTITTVIYEGDDLSDNFNVIPNSGYACNWTNPIFEVTSLVPGNTYTVECDYAYAFSQVFNGSSIDTIVVTGPTTLASPGSEITGNYSIDITNTNGCSWSGVFDTVQFVNPLAAFETASDAYYKNDSVIVLNQYVRNNPLWSVVPNDLPISNINSPIPNIIGTNYGLHKINLRNEHIPLCIDSSYRHIRICDTMPDIALNTHWQINSVQRYSMIDVELDQFGNSFELNVKKTYQPGSPWIDGNELLLTKRAPNGDFMWTQNFSIVNSNTSGVVVESIDFDENGDVYAALWIEADNLLTYGTINYTPLVYNNQRRCYIVKYNGLTGAMVWTKDLSAMLVANGSTGINARCRTTDVKLSDNKIYFSIGSAQRMVIGCINYAGTYIHHKDVNISTGAMPNNFHIWDGSTGSNNETYFGPKIELLSSGELLVSCYFSGIMYVEGSSVQIANTNGKLTLFVFKYNTTIGLYDFKKVATYNGNVSMQAFFDRPYFDVDENDNINFAISWDKQGMIIEGDSVELESGVAIIQYDTNYNMNWINFGSNLVVQGFKVAKGSGDIYLLGKAPYNFGIGDGTENYMMGIYGDTDFIDSLIYMNSYLIQNDLRREDVFLTRMNSNGQVLDGKSFIQSNYYQYNNASHFVQSKIGVAPCGDIVLGFNSRPYVGPTVEMVSGNSSFNIDSSYLIKYGINLAPTNCSYLANVNDSILYCTGDDSLNVLIGNFYNLDSIQYYLINNGIPQPIISVPVDDHLSIPLNNGMTEGVIIISPSIDSIVLIPTTISFNVQYDTLICNGTNLTFTASPSTNSYSWWNNTSSGPIFTANTSFYQEGLNQMNVLVTSPIGCTLSDTLDYYVNFPDPPAITGYAPSLCYNDSMTIVATPSTTIFSSPQLGTSIGTMTLNNSNYSLGANQIITTYVDSNGCSVQNSMIVDVIAPDYPNYSGIISPICYGDELEIIASPSYFEIYWPVTGISSDTLVFNPLIYNSGPNNIDYISTDLNGCEGSGSLYLIVNTVPDPTFNSNYSVGCDESLIIPFNTQDYTGIGWMINGNTQPNNFSGLNLSNGVNEINVFLEASNSCTLDTIITIDYCFDLGVENIDSDILHVYPNPTNNELNISLNSGELNSLRILDQSGRLVFEKDKINDFQIQIALPELQVGIYQLVINSTSKEYTKIIFID